MKTSGEKNRPAGEGRPAALRLTAYAWVWVAVAVLAAASTQALRSPVSYSFAVTVAILPVIELVYVIAAGFSVKCSFADDDGKAAVKVTRYESRGLTVSVKNRFPLPVPFVTLRMEGGAEEPCASVSLRPAGTERLISVFRFSRLGTAECRIVSVSVDSLLRFFRLTVRQDAECDVLVLPRKLNVAIPEPVTSVRSSVNSFAADGSDSDDVGDISEYQPGDKLKNIHWKLSGKNDELLVRRFGRRFAPESLIVPDLRDADGEGRGTDILLELALAAVRDRADFGRKVTLRLPDGRGTAYGCVDTTFDGPDLPDGIEELTARAADARCGDLYGLFARAPVDETVLVTDRSDPGTKGFINGLSEAFPPVTVIYCRRGASDCLPGAGTAVFDAEELETQ